MSHSTPINTLNSAKNTIQTASVNSQYIPVVLAIPTITTAVNTSSQESSAIIHTAVTRAVNIINQYKKP